MSEVMACLLKSGWLLLPDSTFCHLFINLWCLLLYFVCGKACFGLSVRFKHTHSSLRTYRDACVSFCLKRRDAKLVGFQFFKVIIYVTFMLLLCTYVQIYILLLLCYPKMWTNLSYSNFNLVLHFTL